MGGEREPQPGGSDSEVYEDGEAGRALGNRAKARPLWGEGGRETVPRREGPVHLQERCVLRVLPKALGMACSGLF